MQSLFQIFAKCALNRADKTAFTFLVDGEEKEVRNSYGQLYDNVLKCAGNLNSLGLFQKPVLLLYPSGIEYIKAFLACLAAGVIAVPVYPPRSSKHADRINHILKDSGATTILTTEKLKGKLETFDQKILSGCELLTLNANPQSISFDGNSLQSPQNIAFIQYTSGSTGDPKGVIITNKNLIVNQQQLYHAGQHNPNGVIVSWLPRNRRLLLWRNSILC